MKPSPTLDPVEIRRALEMLREPGDTFEVRVLEVSGATWNGRQDPRHYPTGYGYFRDPETAAKEAARVLSGSKCAGVYTTMNSTAPALFSRAADRLKPAGKKDSTTSDADIHRLRWLLVDLDYQRPANISTTDEEHEAALTLARRIRDGLVSHGFPEPVICDSGNGAHLLFRIDLQAEDSALVKRVLIRLERDFGTDGVKVDQTVFNPARIVKLYGTLAAKGDSTPERPHRMSRILEVPQDLRPVPRALLEEYAGELEKPAPSEPAGYQDGIDLEALIRKHWPDAQPKTGTGGTVTYGLSPCPWNSEHKVGAFAGRRANGALFAGCRHNGCSGKNWQDFKAALGIAATPKQERPEKTQSTPVLVTLSTVEPEEVDWLWEGRIPLAKLTLLEGDPGTGKSTASLEIAAAVTTGGTLPDGGRVKASDVVILSAEDGAADTIRPRIDAAGGDASRIHLLTAVNTSEGEETPDLCSHIPMIRAAVEMKKAALVIIDPLMAYLGPDVNSHRDQDIRRTLAPLAKMAEETGAALLVVRHLNKASGGPALYRGGGSIGIAGAARVVLLVAKDPEDDGRRILACVKNNLAPFPPALAFKLVSVGHVARLEWEKEPVNYTADELLAVSFQAPDSQGEKTERKTAKEAAQEWLVQLLWNGPVASKEVDEQIKAAGLSVKTVRNARETLGIIVRRKGYSPDAGWEWRLPEPLRRGRNFETGELLPPSQDAQDPLQDAQEAQAFFDGQLGHLGRQEGHLGKVAPEAGGVTSPGFDLEEEAV